MKDVSQRPLIERDVLEDKYQLLLENCSWGEQMDLLDQLQEVAAMDARQPGITIFNSIQFNSIELIKSQSKNIEMKEFESSWNWILIKFNEFKID